VEGALGIDWRETRARAVETLAEIDETIDPDKPARDLRKAQQQLVQIARASATSARILIFDEPTAALTNRESERLFTFIDRFKAGGGPIFYISHRLDEILRLAGRISVLRDGCLVASLDPNATNKDEMVRLMAARKVIATAGPKPQPTGAGALALRT
jgi:ribose transport system ATP-binding protein